MLLVNRRIAKAIVRAEVKKDHEVAVNTPIAPIPATSYVMTNVVTPFLIQGPRFGDTPGAWKGIDYYINVDAVGGIYTVGGSKAEGQQVFAAMYAGTIGAPGNFANDPTNASNVPYAGSCLADTAWGWLCEPGTPQPGGWGGISPNYSDLYLNNVKNSLGSNGRVLACWGGYYADVMGLFGPSQPKGFPGQNPTSVQVVQSFLSNFCGVNCPNPLNWVRQNSTKTSSYEFVYQGLILDFENIGNGDPLSSYPIAPPAQPPTMPPQQGDIVYTPYINAIQAILPEYYKWAPSLFLGNAPASLCVVADQGNTNVCAPNTALSTYFPFATATLPPTDPKGNNPFSSAVSQALTHPAQMAYFDDIFVQFYNESADYYPGGQYFANLLACWGYVAIEAQKLGIKRTTINLGLAAGNIIPGKNSQGNIVANGQGPTPAIGVDAPYTYWWPQYGASSPPNVTNVPIGGQSWPNTGPAKDPVNVATAITSANAMLRTALSLPNLNPSDWLSGIGFWAGAGATEMAQNVYDKTNPLSPGAVLPAQQTYCWSDASYPAPNPNWGTLTVAPPATGKYTNETAWVSNLPIQNKL
jgi:hypothetical protein